MGGEVRKWGRDAAQALDTDTGRHDNPEQLSGFDSLLLRATNRDAFLRTGPELFRTTRDNLPVEEDAAHLEVYSA